MKISVVIPALDEAARIDGLLQRLAGEALWEILVVDGGSTDGTPLIVGRHTNVRLLSAPRGRARQMNAGAKAATGDVLLFLHADTLPPPAISAGIRVALTDPGTVAGAFRIRTICDGQPNWAVPLLPLADLRSRYTGLPYGDQAMFVRSDFFWKVGGFPDQPLMEDVELSRRLRRVGKIRVLPQVVTVSGRRFLARPVYYTLAVNFFPWFYRLGVKPQTLGRWYGNPR